MIGRRRNLSQPLDDLRVVVRGGGRMRLDVYLQKILGWRSRTRLQNWIREGRVRVNGEPAKPSRRVHAGDVVEVSLPRGTGVPDDYAERELEILYEDDWVVAVNKPPDLLVHPVGRHVYDTLINYLHYRYLGDGTAERCLPRLCHRIDRDTTGVLVAARDDYVHREITYQFEHRLVEKEYVALVEGVPSPSESVIRIPIGEGHDLESSLKHPARKPSETHLRLERDLGRWALVSLRPHTGRQNQIRIHLAAIGHPIVGDERYGNGPAPDGFPHRYLLHARRLRFRHPRLHAAVHLKAPLPEDFRILLERLGGRRARRTTL